MTQILCPKCSAKMSEWNAAGVALDNCRQCKGLWFDRGELARHFENLGSTVSEGDLVDGGDTRFACPRCTDARLHEGKLDGVKVDACQECHGIFLDLGEVHELLGALIRQRGVDGEETAGFDNFTLGLYIGAHMHSTS